MLMLIVLAPHLSGCFNTVQVDPGTPTKPAKFVGVTTKAGDSLAFRPNGARWQHDTLYASTDRGPIAVPRDSVRYVWVQRYSSGKTVTLIVIGAVVTIAALVIASHGSSSAYGGGGPQ
jgi:hypothetical protein